MKTSDKALNCEICDLWYHSTCADITNEVYEFLVQNASSPTSTIHWYCEGCNRGVLNVVKTMSHIQQEQAKVKGRLDNLESAMGEIIAEVATLKTKDRSREKTEIEHSTVNHTVKEMTDRAAREANFIIFEVPESEGATSEEKISEDKNIVLNICDNICKTNITDSNITKTVRLGKRQEGERRPLLVNLESKELKKSLFPNLSKLKEAEEPYCEFRIDHDMTQAPGEEARKLRAKAKEMTENAKGKATFRVRGHPLPKKMIKIQGETG